MSKFTFTKLPDGFEVEWKGKVTVKFQQGANVLTTTGTNKGVRGIFEYWELSHDIIYGISKDFKPKWQQKNRQVWISEHIGKKIGKAIHAEWKDLLTRLPQDIVQVERQFFRAVGPKRYPRQRNFWSYAAAQDKQVLADISKYLAAATYYYGGNEQFWRDVILGQNKKDKWANQTLDELNVYIPQENLLRLAYVPFVRQLKTKAELITATCYDPIESKWDRVRAGAEHENIKKAFEIIRPARDNLKVNTRKYWEIDIGVKKICDFNGKMRGNSFTKLAEKSVDWYAEKIDYVPRKFCAPAPP